MFILAAAIVMSVSTASSADRLAGVASVIDGDTIVIRDKRIRLFGIDAPESGQFCTRNNKRYRCGQTAALALADKIGRRVVRCNSRDTDRYGRMVAVCDLNGLDLNAWMVQTGHAIAYRKYSTAYVPQEEMAHTAHRGIWAGKFQKPSDYRHRPRAKRSTQARGVCICPNDRDRAGRRCGKRSAYFRSGGKKPSCGQ